jgi:short-subunit dehydrogenase
MVVVITGASSGIGRDLAIELDRAGAKLVLAARRLDKLDELNIALGSRHKTIVCDVSIEADCARLIETSVSHFGRIDTMVCNAGYGLVTDTSSTTSDQMHAIFRTNVFGTSDCIRFAMPHLMRNEMRDGFRGQVVLVSSAAARRGLPMLGAYSATKAAQLSLAEALRVELRSVDIAVTSVHPITTKSDFFTVAESVSGRGLGGSMRKQFAQSGQTVARAMVRAIARPRREVWPFPTARWGLALNAVWPGIGDRIMTRLLHDMDRPA